MLGFDGGNIAQIAVEESEGDRQRCVELLSGDRRVDWNIKNRNGDTPVMYCLKNNKIEMATTIVTNTREDRETGTGVDLQTRDSDGWSLVSRAISKREIGTCALSIVNHFKI